jgi:hypothetical protein
MLSWEDRTTTYIPGTERSKSTAPESNPQCSSASSTNGYRPAPCNQRRGESSGGARCPFYARSAERALCSIGPLTGRPLPSLNGPSRKPGCVRLSPFMRRSRRGPPSARKIHIFFHCMPAWIVSNLNGFEPGKNDSPAAHRSLNTLEYSI